MDMNGAVDVRQVSTPPAASSNLACVVTRSSGNEHTLLLVDYEAGCVKKKLPEITSAVFSRDGAHIIAGRDTYEENIIVLDHALTRQNMIKFTFPGLSDEIQIDKYRVLWVSEPKHDSYLIFMAYHED